MAAMYLNIHRIRSTTVLNSLKPQCFKGLFIYRIMTNQINLFFKQNSSGIIQAPYAITILRKRVSDLVYESQLFNVAGFQINLYLLCYMRDNDLSR